MTVTLRPYQTKAVDDLRAAYGSGSRAPLLVAPTGAGKTVIFSFVAQSSASRGKRVLIVAHRRELIRQASAKLTDAGVQHGIIAPGFTPSSDPVQVGSIQTLGRRLDRLSPFDLLVIDEGHHAIAGQWAQLIAAQSTARILGVTATPERLDGRGLGLEAGGCFDSMILGPTIAELIDGGFLTPSKVFAPSATLDLSAVRTKGGDFETRSLEAAMDNQTITGDCIAHYQRHAPGQPAIAFCASVQHARDVALAFRDAGWRAMDVSGETPAAQRDAAIQGLADGRTQVLTTCDLISEGLDVPTVGAVILLRPTQSLGLHVQQVGRGLRPAAGKTHLTILDHAGNTLRHGLPDSPREWSLDGRKKRSRKAGEADGPAVKQCPSCFLMNASAARRCIECDHEFSGGRTIQAVEGELTEVDAGRIASLRAVPLGDLLRTASTEADLREIARARGYRPGWVFRIMQERRQRRASVAA